MRLRPLDTNTTDPTEAAPSEPINANPGKRRLVLVEAGATTTRIPANIEQIRAAVARSRAEQGLPPTIEDPDVLARVAAVFKLAVAPAPVTVSRTVITRTAA